MKIIGHGFCAAFWATKFLDYFSFHKTNCIQDLKENITGDNYLLFTLQHVKLLPCPMLSSSFYLFENKKTACILHIYIYQNTHSGGFLYFLHILFVCLFVCLIDFLFLFVCLFACLLVVFSFYVFEIEYIFIWIIPRITNFIFTFLFCKIKR